MLLSGWRLLKWNAKPAVDHDKQRVSLFFGPKQKLEDAWSRGIVKYPYGGLAGDWTQRIGPGWGLRKRSPQYLAANYLQSVIGSVLLIKSEKR